MLGLPRKDSKFTVKKINVSKNHSLEGSKRLDINSKPSLSTVHETLVELN